METTIVYWGCIGTMEKRMETTIVYWGYILFEVLLLVLVVVIGLEEVHADWVL